MNDGRNRPREDATRAALQSTTQTTPAPAPANLTEDQRWDRSKLRWKPLIDSKDPEFKAVLQKYAADLQEKSVHNILTESFSKHEIRKFESGYVDSKRSPEIHKTQKNDAERFREKMGRCPWSDLDPNVRSSLVFKLTLMHFGFPVEPMRFTDPLNLSGPLANLGFTSAFQDDDGDDFDDNDMTFVPEELRPLRFLNSYDKRGYGKDNSHMNPDRTSELYYGIPMMVKSQDLSRTVSLRGGGDDNDDDDDDQPSVMGDDEDPFMDDDAMDEDSTLPLEEVQIEYTPMRESGDPISLRGGSGRTATENVTQPAITRDFLARPRTAIPPTMPLDNNGFPMRGEVLDDFAKGKIFREWSYGRPLSINMQGQAPSIPINAPPLEALLKTPGHGALPSDSVPVISTQVMTPTEQRHLQEAFFRMRTFALNRAQPCPYEGCLAYFPVDDAGLISFRKHLKDAHMGVNCPFCKDPLFAYYSPKQIKDHFIDNHSDYFSMKDDLRRDTGATCPDYQNVHRREEMWNYCARCGRNHNLLNVKADRQYHDNTCYPGAPIADVVASDGGTRCFCRHCGLEDLGSLDSPHDCKATPEDIQQKVFCPECAFPTHVLSRIYAHKHISHCRGAAHDRASWCPWCAIDLTILSPQAKLKHLADCALKPLVSQGPLDTTTGNPNPSPRDNEDNMKNHTYFRYAPEVGFIKVPKVCPVKGCTETNLDKLSSAELYDHFSKSHKIETKGNTRCGLCDLDFQKRFVNFSPDFKKSHFEDHIQNRTVRILSDKLIAASPNKGDPLVKGLLDYLRNQDVVDQSARIKELEDKLDQSRRIEQLQRDLDDCRTHGPGGPQSATSRVTAPRPRGPATTPSPSSNRSSDTSTPQTRNTQYSSPRSNTSASTQSGGIASSASVQKRPSEDGSSAVGGDDGQPGSSGTNKRVRQDGLPTVLEERTSSPGNDNDQSSRRHTDPVEPEPTTAVSTSNARPSTGSGLVTSSSQPSMSSRTPRRLMVEGVSGSAPSRPQRTIAQQDADRARRRLGRSTTRGSSTLSGASPRPTRGPGRPRSLARAATRSTRAARQASIEEDVHEDGEGEA